MFNETINNSYNKLIDINKGLYVISSPIGNRYDISIRAIKILEVSDVILCEDTRTTKKLFKLLNINIKAKKWISYNDYSTDFKRKFILNELKKDQIISLISDAGTPLISDPGYKLINIINKSGYKIYSIPGACAAIASLVISGLRTDKFCFLGFLPKNKSNYLETLKKFSSLDVSIIIYENPNRISFFLKTLKDIFVSFKLVIVRELTKKYEEIIFIDNKNIDLYLEKKFRIKGEITIILEVYNTNEIIYSDQKLLMELKKLKPSQVASMLSKTSNESRNTLYERCLRILNEKKS